MYCRLLKYVAPLIIVSMSIDFSDTLLNAGLVLSETSFQPFNTTTPSSSLFVQSPSSSSSSLSNTTSSQVSRLAAFGAAHRILRWLWSGSWEMRAVGIRLVKNKGDYCPALWFALLMSGMCSFLMIVMAITPIGNWITGIAVETPAGRLLAMALLSLSILPMLKAIDRLHEGLLLQQKKTIWVSASGLLDLLTQLAVLAAMLGDTSSSSSSSSNPLIAPILALYVGMICKMMLVGIGVCCMNGSNNKKTKQKISLDDDDDDYDQKYDQQDYEENHVRKRKMKLGREAGCYTFILQIISLWWPLAWVKAFQGISRPLMNLLVASHGGVVGVAVLTLCFPLGHLFYGGLNNVKGIAAAFMDVPGSLLYVKRFIPTAVLVSFGTGFIFLWSPSNGYGALAIMTGFGADSDLVERCIVPLRIFSFFCFAVGLRNYFTALAILYKKTGPLAWSGPVRVTILVTMGWGVLNAGFNLTGGTLGIAALFSGFIAEATTVVICTQCCCGKNNDANHTLQNHKVVALEDDDEEEIFSAAVGIAVVDGSDNTMRSRNERSDSNGSIELSSENDKHKYKDISTIFEVSFPWTEKILNGKKIIETRTYALPTKYLHQTLGLYETHNDGSGIRDRCVGLIEFSGCKEYKTKLEWEKDSTNHCVPNDATPAEYGWVEGTPRYGWKVSHVQRTKRHPLPMRFERNYRSFFDVRQW